MTRTTVNIAVQNHNDLITVTPTTINAALVTAGVAVPGAYDVKPGTTEVRLTNTDTAAHTATFKAGGFATGINGDYTISVPAGATVVQLCNMIEAQTKQLDGSLNIDFSTGFVGSLDVTGETLHIAEV